MSTSLNPQFYLGRIFDPAQGKAGSEAYRYDPSHLTTHGVVTGMTGSGKTGLCVGLLEEAALRQIPAIIIDVKGDLTNLVLHFPELQPADFQPWLDAESIRGKDPAAVAVETADRWTKGLEEWGLGKADLQMLSQAMKYTIYTPGSSAGKPVNILSSFACPELPWEENRELLREKISSTVTALLGLVGMKDIDPLRSREHILLSNVLETAWSQGKSLDLSELILQTQNPPMQKLGVFPLDQFFPQKDRFELAMLLNNFLASPSFQAWQEGQVLDAQQLLYTPDGKPRHSIFYIAHLAENERMFFVTLLFSAVEAWMHAQTGTGALRALIYMDEILGYLPPIGNPPSHGVMLRMLKQARAFGVGLLLATQNPVDVDYKALSNAGTWFIGRLQTEQDRERLVDGVASAGGGFDRGEFARLVAGLQKRVFLAHNVHKSGDVLFQTRWALNFLAGPMTRTQIPALNKLAGVDGGEVVPVPTMAASAAPAAAQKPSSRPAAPAAEKGDASSQTRPAAPLGVSEVFVADSLGVSKAAKALKSPTPCEMSGIVYHPVLLAQAEIRYLSTKYNINTSRRVSARMEEFEGGTVDWEELARQALESDSLQPSPVPQARFFPLPAFLQDPKRLKMLRSDFEAWVFRSGTLQLRTNDLLKVYAGPESSAAEFHTLCSQEAQRQLQAELQKQRPVLEKKASMIRQKVQRAELEVKERESQLSQRRMETLSAGGEMLLGLFGGRKKSLSSTLSKNRMAEKAEQELEQARAALTALQNQAALEEKTLQNEMERIRERWEQAAAAVGETPLAPSKSNIFVEYFGIAWMPFYAFDCGADTREIAAWGEEA